MCVSLFPEDFETPVFTPKAWWADDWDAIDYGQEYDFSKLFFEQIKKLLNTVPRLGIWNVGCKNSLYTNQSYYNKNTYLSFAVRDCEDIAYVSYAFLNKQSLDSSYIFNSEHCYEGINIKKSYNSFHIQNCEGMIDSQYAIFCRNCENVFGGINLRFTKNNFFGEQLTKEEYEKRIKKLKLDKRSVRNEIKNRFNKIKSKSIVKATQQTKCVNCIGDYLTNAKDCYWVFNGANLEKVKYSSWIFSSKDIYDTFGIGGSELIYEAISPENVRDCKFIFSTDSSHNCEHTIFCQDSANLFGCVSIRNGEYMILNYPYTKEKYTELIKEIKKDMDDMPYIDKKGLVYKYGEFFPSELSPFGYNETIAQEYFPLTKEEALKQGYEWKDENLKSYNPTLKPNEVPDSILEVPDGIINEVIACEHNNKCKHKCTTAFKITKDELVFYRKHNIPLPVLCPNCRHGERISCRNPKKLWDRNCHNCNEKIKTSYSPDRPEIVYCEKCYQKEVI